MTGQTAQEARATAERVHLAFNRLIDQAWQVYQSGGGSSAYRHYATLLDQRREMIAGHEAEIERLEALEVTERGEITCDACGLPKGYTPAFSDVCCTGGVE